MKKIAIAAPALLLIGSLQFAHAQAFEQGNVDVSAGYGFPNLVGAIFNAYENQQSYTAKSVGPVFAKLEYAASDKIGIGIDFAYASTKVTYLYEDINGSGNYVNYTNEWDLNGFSILARVNWHFGDSDAFDPYFGMGVGYRHNTYTFTSNDPFYGGDETLGSFNPFGFDMTVGARYFFTDNIGAYAELGIAKAPVQIGLTAKF